LPPVLPPPLLPIAGLLLPSTQGDLEEQQTGTSVKRRLILGHCSATGEGSEGLDSVDYEAMPLSPPSHILSISVVKCYQASLAEFEEKHEPLTNSEKVYDWLNNGDSVDSSDEASVAEGSPRGRYPTPPGAPYDEGLSEYSDGCYSDGRPFIRHTGNYRPSEQISSDYEDQVRNPGASGFPNSDSRSLQTLPPRVESGDRRSQQHKVLCFMWARRRSRSFRIWWATIMRAGLSSDDRNRPAIESLGHHLRKESLAVTDDDDRSSDSAYSPGTLSTWNQ